MTSTFGKRCLTATDTPATSPPPPTGTTTASILVAMFSICSMISSAIVP